MLCSSNLPKCRLDHAVVRRHCRKYTSKRQTLLDGEENDKWSDARGWCAMRRKPECRGKLCSGKNVEIAFGADCRLHIRAICKLHVFFHVCFVFVFNDVHIEFAGCRLRIRLANHPKITCTTNCERYVSNGFRRTTWNEVKWHRSQINRIRTVIATTAAVVIAHKQQTHTRASGSRRRLK